MTAIYLNVAAKRDTHHDIGGDILRVRLIKWYFFVEEPLNYCLL